jgi:hypothetical protein
MKKIELKNLNGYSIYDVIYARTSPLDYEMEREILLHKGDSFIYLEGGHCSRYDFDDTIWEGFEYTLDEVEELAKYDDSGWKIFLKGYLSVK